MGEVGCRIAQHFPGVGDHKFTQLAGLAEGNRPDSMLYALSLCTLNPAVVGLLVLYKG